MMLRVELFCKVLPLPIHSHGSVYVVVTGTTDEEMAKISAMVLIKHRCHVLHEQAGVKNCQCRAWPHEITKISWEGRKDRSQRRIMATVVGGEGEVLSWYPISTKGSTVRW